MREWRDAVRARLAGLRLAPDREASIVRELSEYLEDRYRGLCAEGVPEPDARRQVLAEVADAGGLAAALRQTEPRPGADAVTPGVAPVRGLAPGGLWQDLRYGFRSLRLNAGLSLVAVATLALGIGANTAMFQLLDVVTLRALPVRDPASLVEIRIANFDHATGRFTGRHVRLTYAQWQQIQRHEQSLTGAFAWGVTSFDLSHGGVARYANGLWVSGSFFEVLGVRPAVGRLLADADDRPACGSPGVVLGHAFWMREYGGDPAIVGRTITLSGQPFDVVGVTPPGFFGVDVGWQFDVAAPLCAQPLVAGNRDAFDTPHYWWLAAMGRLKPGVSADQATAELRAASPAIFHDTLPPSFQPRDAQNYLAYRLGAFPAATGISSLRATFDAPLWLLFGMTGLVLLIACANLANLLLARASARQREIAVRLALGASRARLIRQLLVESLLVAAAGALAGIFVARTLSRFLVAFLDTARDPLFLDLHLDWRVLAFAIGLGALTCLLVGLVPALRATATTPVSVMKAQGRGLTSGRERLGLRRLLVVVQVALSAVLVIGAALFVRTFRNLATVDPGFRRAGVFVAELDLSPLGTRAADQPALHRDVLARLGAIPGVTRAAETSTVQGLDHFWNEYVMVDADTSPRGLTDVSTVSPGYLQAMEIPLVAGRRFSPRESPDDERVAIVSETFRAKYLKGQDAVGRTFRFQVGPGEPETTYRVIGVMKDTKYANVRDAFKPLVYLDALQVREPGLHVRAVIRSELPLAAVTSAVSAVMAKLSPTITMTVQPLDRGIGDSMALERVMATLSGFFGALAALIATIGLYGVIAYSVAQRRNEIGIRMALGADRRRVVAMIVGEAAVLLGAGLVFGVATALVSGRAVRALLFELSPYDPSTLLAAVGGLAAVTLAASCWPARRAARLDPMTALREE